MSRGEASSGRPRGSAAMSAVMSWARRWFEPALLVATAVALLSGGLYRLGGREPERLGRRLLGGRHGTVAVVLPAVAWVVAALRHGPGVDLIAVLALVGTLAVGEYLAGALIALMLATGRALEAAAQRRASHDLRALLEHAPRPPAGGPARSPGPAGRGRRRRPAGRRPG